MKRSKLLTVGVIVAALTVFILSACEQKQAPSSPAEVSGGDSGLVPGQASTGNPPLIPHEVDPSDGGKECLGCHREGGQAGAPKIPAWHDTLTDCRQCHVVKGEQVGEFSPQY